MTVAHGSCDPAFEPVRTALAALVDSGEDIGCSAAIVLDGRFVADVWAGHVDGSRTEEWQADTITNVWSTTKTMTNLSALILSDQGELDLDAPVGNYWPEFKVAGKEGVLVRHLLGHTAGLPSWRRPMTVADVLDWDKACSVLASEEPWWEPGTASGYHALTQGNLVGEVIRRVTGQTVGHWFAENVAGPLGADFHIGTPESCDARIANIIPPSTAEQPPGIEPDSIAARAFASPVDMKPEAALTTEWRRAEVPAAGGHGNARSVALVQSLVSGLGETHGKRLFSPNLCDRIFEEQANGTDLVLRMPFRLGIGYGLRSDTIPFPSERTCFWGGWGGSLVINDLDNHMTVAYVMNRMGEGTTGDMRAFSIIMAAYQSLAAR